MTNSTDIVSRLRDKSAHSAEAYGLEEYMPMAAFWKSYADLSAEAADLIQSQQALIEEMREAYTAYEAALANREHGGVAAHKCVDRIGFALSQKDQIDG